MSDTLHESEPWQRLPGERNLWFARFERYRLAGPKRSLLGVVNAERARRDAKPGRSAPQAWAKAAKQWRWQQRAEAWDEQQRLLARAAHADAVREMNERQIQEAKALQSLAIQRLKSCNPEKLSTSDVLRYLIEAAKLERTALGEPQSIAEQRLTGPGGGAVAFTLEDALEAQQELEKWHHEHHAQRSPLLPEGILEVS